MGFLDNIIEEKRQELAAKRAALPMDALRDRIDGNVPIRDFKEALTGGGRIIAEIKKKSPRVAEFRQAQAAGELPALYERSGAAAVSVVVDSKHFGTSLRDAQTYRRDMSLPVIVKDFVVDPYQICEARTFDADAVLLIARILPVTELASLLALARELGMNALVETHNKLEIKKALSAGADVIGINNRDLDTMEVTLDTTRRLIDAIPRDITVVSESGIYTREEIEELSTLGVDAFLIGGSLLESADPGALLRMLLGREPSKETH